MPQRLLMLDTPDGALEDLATVFGQACEDCSIERVFALDRLCKKLQSGLGLDLVVVDYLLGDGKTTGAALLKKIRRVHAEIPIIAVAEQADVKIAAKAVQAGATDLLVRSGDLTERVATLLDKIGPHLRLIDSYRVLREQNMLLRQADQQRYRILGESPQIREVMQRIERVAAIPRPVLIIGERGTGKELVARAIHAAGGDPTRPLVCVNCAAFPDTLLESELFGHEKGSFTGAENRTHGKFELARGGSLFLDEIGNMSLSFQQKILRVVEYGTFTRVGGSEEVSVNTRIIAATNVDLKQRMEEGQFLHDLYDRLSFEVIGVPPLRERQGDVALLTRHFLNEFMREIPALRGKRLSQAAIDVLERYAFPGNVRELKNIIERAAYRDTTSEITPEDIGMLPDHKIDVQGKTFYDKLTSFKKGLILEALAETAGNQAKAARALGLDYHQYRYYLRKYTKDC